VPRRERLSRSPARGARPAPAAPVRTTVSPLAVAMRAALGGPLTPTGVLALQRAIGNRAVGQLLHATGAGRPRIQRKSWLYRNNTGYRFEIVDDGDRYINARSRAQPLVGTWPFRKPAPAQSGFLRYSTDKTHLFIEHIETDPENGTGLGPLLILLAAQKAKALGLPTISVLNLRYPDYYARWGFDVATPRARKRQMYVDAGREEDIPEVIAVEQADATPDYVIGRTAGYVGRDWTDEWAATALTANDTATLTEFPRFDDE
jgi:hypothetical protein